jgi:hypothetical protein
VKSASTAISFAYARQVAAARSVAFRMHRRKLIDLTIPEF